MGKLFPPLGRGDREAESRFRRASEPVRTRTTTRELGVSRKASPDPGPPVTVGLDGGYIRGRERRPGGTGCFEVIAGKSIPEEGPSTVFAGVQRVDTKPKRRLHEVLQSQGVLPRQRVTFLSDGRDTVRELPAYLHLHSEHILDWFHIGMRVEQLSQTARGFRGKSGI